MNCDPVKYRSIKFGSCHQCAQSSRIPEEIADSGHDSPGGSLTLPDPWLFDSEALLREIDRIRETALQVPTSGDSNATHFGLQLVINAAWNLRENIRYLLQLHRECQKSFREQHARGEHFSSDPKPQHQTIYALFTQWLITC